MSKPWQPYDYQMRGAATLITHDGAGLLLDPGMGKTAIALTAFQALRDRGLAKKMLVVAPIKPMYDTWVKEPRKWDHTKNLRVSIIHGDHGKKARARDKDADVYVINPEGIDWLERNSDPGQLPTVLCVDESTKFKNATSKRFKALRRLIDGDEFNYRWILTGTFVPNGLKDVFGQVYIMDRGEALGTYVTHFKRKWFDQTGYGGYVLEPREGAHEEITQLIADRVLRLNAEDYLNMPDLQNINRMVTLPDEAMAHYKRVEKDFITQCKDGTTLTAANQAAAGTKCRQIANGAIYLDEGDQPNTTGPREWKPMHDQKLQALDELVAEISEPMLIVYEYKHDLARIQDALGNKAVCITGVTGNRLNKLLSQFNEGQVPYLLAHAGSLHGINIQGACRHMVWYGMTWNLEHYKQAVWRLYRQGQQLEYPVMVYHILAEGTLDEAVADTLQAKDAEQQHVEELLKNYKV